MSLVPLRVKESMDYEGQGLIPSRDQLLLLIQGRSQPLSTHTGSILVRSDDPQAGCCDLHVALMA